MKKLLKKPSKKAIRHRRRKLAKKGCGQAFKENPFRREIILEKAAELPINEEAPLKAFHKLITSTEEATKATARASQAISSRYPSIEEADRSMEKFSISYGPLIPPEFPVPKPQQSSWTKFKVWIADTLKWS